MFFLSIFFFFHFHLQKALEIKFFEIIKRIHLPFPVNVRLKNDKLFEEGGSRGRGKPFTHLLVSPIKMKLPSRMIDSFCLRRGCNIIFVSLRATIYPRAYLTGYVEIYTIHISRLEERDKDEGEEYS